MSSPFDPFDDLTRINRLAEDAAAAGIAAWPEEATTVRTYFEQHSAACQVGLDEATRSGVSTCVSQSSPEANGMVFTADAASQACAEMLAAGDRAAAEYFASIEKLIGVVTANANQWAATVNPMAVAVTPFPMPRIPVFDLDLPRHRPLPEVPIAPKKRKIGF